MTKIFSFNLKFVLCFLLAYSFSSLYSQPSALLDEIISKTYNLNFDEIPGKIEVLKKTSPQVAQYVKVDYLWWRMISSFNPSTESLFLAELTSLNIKNSENEEYKKLAYFIYQIRYDNFRNKSFIKYLTLLKFHYFLQKIDPEKIKKFDQFVINMFNLIAELELFMEYKFLSDNGFQSKKNTVRCKSSLVNMEGMTGFNNISFDIIRTYLLGKIYLDIEHNYPQAFKKFEKLSAMFPQNNIFMETVAGCKKHLPTETGD
jgi:hypothetical protein